MNTDRRSTVVAIACLPTLISCSSDQGADFAPSKSLEAWSKFLGYRGLRTEALRPYELVQASLDFFTSTKASGLGSDPESDMLLYQWGVFDFGKGEFFQFDITRQFIADGLFSDEAFSQLRCTAYFEPSAELRSIPMSNRWCKSRAELAEFKKFILGSKAFAAVENLVPKKVIAEWGRV